MEFFNRKDICPSCNKKIESSFLAGSSPGAVDQCWYFNCSFCKKSFKSIHSNQKIFRNIFYILPIFFLGIATIVTFIIGTPLSYSVGAGCLVLTVLLIFLYRKNAYGKLEEIRSDEFEKMMEGTERHRIIQKHKKGLLPQRLALTLFYMAIYIAVMKYFDKW